MKAKEGKILVVDDNESILKSLRQLLKHDFEQVKTLSSPNLIQTTLRSESFDVVLLDMNFSAGVMTGNEGIFWMKEILKIDPSAVIILITAYGDVELAVKAIKEGGTDFIVKPWNPEKLLATLYSALKLKKSKLEVKSLKGKQKVLTEDIDKQFDLLIGISKKMKEVLTTIKKVARTDANILILGENGTGKELIAREIHKRSNRSQEAFVGVDIGSLTESLFESEMFGHVKGAYTDAKEDRTGRFEIASGGTLFLDEIGNLSVSLQAKLLKAIQDREIIRVGASIPIPVDIRLICATNTNLEELVLNNLFREDLLYRINTIQIHLPPLRERKDDIPLLLEYFLKKYQKKYHKPPFKVSEKAYGKLNNHLWPGNIREFKHTIEKVVILSESNTIKSDDFFFGSAIKPKYEQYDTMNLADVEKNIIEKALKASNGNLSNAAKILNISRTTLYSKIKKYGL